MTYTLAAGIGLVAAVIVDWWVLRTRLLASRAFWLTYPIVLVFQLVSNGFLTARAIVNYAPSQILGVRLVHAPVEDLAFGFALVLASLSSWVWHGRRGEELGDG